MEEGVVRSRFGHFWSFLEVCVVVFVTHVVPFFDKSHFLILLVCSAGGGGQWRRGHAGGREASGGRRRGGGRLHERI